MLLRARCRKMDWEVEAAAHRAIDAINDRTFARRAEKPLDPSAVRHDLGRLFPRPPRGRAGVSCSAIIANAPERSRISICPVEAMITDRLGQSSLNRRVTCRGVSPSR